MGLTWYLQRNGTEEGPFTPAHIAEMASGGKLFPHDYIKRSDMEKWVVAGRVKGLNFQSPIPEKTTQHPLITTTPVLFTQLQTSDGRMIDLFENGTWAFAASTEPPPKQIIQKINSASTKTPSTGPHFRQTSWGMSELEVRDSESGEPEYEIESGFYYSGAIAGLQCDIVYIFCDHQLVRAKYFIQESHTDSNRHIDDYFSLRKLLEDKYGSPVSKSGSQDDMIWFNDLYQDNINDWGIAIECGHLAFQSEWINGDTNICIVLSGDNFQVRHEIEYRSISLQKIENEESQRRHMEDL